MSESCVIDVFMSVIRFNEKPFGIELALVTEDVPAAFEKAVASGTLPLKEPEEKPWGQVVGYVRAVDGTITELCSPIGGYHRIFFTHSARNLFFFFSIHPK